MKELLNEGQLLGRSEMKKIMAGSGGCYDECEYIGAQCFEGAGADELKCFDVIRCCQRQCDSLPC